MERLSKRLALAYGLLIMFPDVTLTKGASNSVRWPNSDLTMTN